VLLIKNTTARYGAVSILIHWVSFLMVAGLFGVGLYMVELTYYDPLYHELPEWHKLFGVILGGLTLIRLVWICFSRPPKVLTEQRWQAVLAKMVHGLLYLILLLLLISGYLISTAKGAPLVSFDVQLLPALVTLEPNQVDLAGLLHYWVAWGLVGVVSLHALAALKHHFIDQDQTLTRILTIKGQNAPLNRNRS